MQRLYSCNGNIYHYECLPVGYSVNDLDVYACSLSEAKASTKPCAGCHQPLASNENLDQRRFLNPLDEDTVREDIFGDVTIYAALAMSAVAALSYVKALIGKVPESERYLKQRSLEDVIDWANRKKDEE